MKYVLLGILLALSLLQCKQRDAESGALKSAQVGTMSDLVNDQARLTMAFTQKYLSETKSIFQKLGGGSKTSFGLTTPPAANGQPAAPQANANPENIERLRKDLEALKLQSTDLSFEVIRRQILEERNSSIADDEKSLAIIQAEYSQKTNDLAEQFKKEKEASEANLKEATELKAKAQGVEDVKKFDQLVEESNQHIKKMEAIDKELRMASEKYASEIEMIQKSIASQKAEEPWGLACNLKFTDRGLNAASKKDQVFVFRYLVVPNVNIGEYYDKKKFNDVFVVDPISFEQAKVVYGSKPMGRLFLETKGLQNGQDGLGVSLELLNQDLTFIATDGYYNQYPPAEDGKKVGAPFFGKIPAKKLDIYKGWGEYKLEMAVIFNYRTLETGGTFFNRVQKSFYWLINEDYYEVNQTPSLECKGYLEAPSEE